jgi:hypothetical protein
MRAAAAAPPETGVDFCKSRPLQEKVSSLAGLPGTKRVPVSGELRFAPDFLFTPKSGELVSAGSHISYQLSLSPSSQLQVSPRLDWHLSGRLTRVDRTGRHLGVVGQMSGESGGITKTAPRSVGLGRRLPPGIYRADIVFLSRDGEKLGRFREYFKVVPKRVRLRLQISSPSFTRGETLLARIVNHGSEPVTFGSYFFLEKHGSLGWEQVPQLYDATTEEPYVFPEGRWDSRPRTVGPCAVAYILPSSIKTGISRPPSIEVFFPGVYRLVKPMGGKKENLVSEEFVVW